MKRQPSKIPAPSEDAIMSESSLRLSTRSRMSIKLAPLDRSFTPSSEDVVVHSPCPTSAIRSSPPGKSPSLERSTNVESPNAESSPRPSMLVKLPSSYQMNASREPAQSIATARSTQAIPAMDVGRLGRGQDENGLIIGYWKVGICDCFSNVYPNCAMSFVCPCISLAQVTHRIGLVRFVVVLIAHGVFYGIAFIFLVLYSKQLQRAKIDVSVKKDTIDKAMQMQDTVTIVLDLLTSCAAAMSRARMYAIVSMVFFGASSVVVWFVRSNVRDAFRIPGNCLEDAAFSICCSCCAIAQVASHTESYEVHKWRIEPRDVLPGYVLWSFQVAPSMTTETSKRDVSARQN